jgi:hypothetical protein
VRHVARRDRARSKNIFSQKSKIEKSQKCKKPTREFPEILGAENRLRKMKTAGILPKPPQSAENCDQSQYRNGRLAREFQTFPMKLPVVASSYSEET